MFRTLDLASCQVWVVDGLGVWRSKFVRTPGCYDQVGLALLPKLSAVKRRNAQHIGGWLNKYKWLLSNIISSATHPLTNSTLQIQNSKKKVGTENCSSIPGFFSNRRWDLVGKYWNAHPNSSNTDQGWISIAFLSSGCHSPKIWLIWYDLTRPSHPKSSWVSIRCFTS